MSIIRQLARVANRIDSASTGTFLSKGDSTGDFTTVNYTDLSGRPTTLDSAALTTIVDSAYIQLRQTSAGSGGLDSAAITALVDSNYVVARSPAASSGFAQYEYTATAGQTTFQDSDINGNVMSYTADGIFVFYNGVLIAPTTDYEATDGSSVVLTTGADSGSHVAISKWSIAGGGSGGSAGIAWGGDRGFILGGSETSNYDDIDYFDITTPGNASTFGNLTGHSEYASSAGSGARVLHAHAYNGSSEPNSVDYITSATTGNASDFGDLTVGNRAGLASCGDGTYVIFYGGGIFSGKTNVIDYFTAATTGNATDFGDDTQSRGSGIGGCSSATRGLFGGGSFTGSPYYTNQISYITIASPGNAADFGDLTQARNGICAMSDNTYAVWAGGYASNDDGGRQNVMDYVTIDTLGNAQDFGDLLAVNNYVAACSNGTYGVIGGGYASGTVTNTLQYVTISSPGNAADFGDLTKVYRASGSASGSPS